MAIADLPKRPLNVLIVLTYYRPHTSGLTIYAERLARGLVERGHHVTVLTSHYNRSHPATEVLHGVRVIRAPVLFRISKGVIMPTFGYLASKYVREADVISLHLPQFDAAGVALRGRMLHKPTLLTYHCDLALPPGLFNKLVNKAVHIMNRLAGRYSDGVVASHARLRGPLTLPANTQNEAPRHPTASRNGRDDEIRDSCLLSDGQPRRQTPRDRHGSTASAEKGVEVLLEAFPTILERYPTAMILFAGQFKDVLAEETYAQRLLPRIGLYEEMRQWRFLGVLDPVQMAAFYPNLDVLTVPSLNSTESFGLVQVEAMLFRCAERGK